MAGFVHFWRMTPDQYAALSIGESNAMFRHMDEVNRAKKQESDRRRRAARRGR